jgi:hypothetical protein
MFKEKNHCSAFLVPDFFRPPHCTVAAKPAALFVAPKLSDYVQPQEILLRCDVLKQLVIL